MVSDDVVVFDNLAGKLHCIVLADPAEARCLRARPGAPATQLRDTLRQPTTPRLGLDFARAGDPEPAFRSELQPRPISRAR